MISDASLKVLFNRCQNADDKDLYNSFNQLHVEVTDKECSYRQYLAMF